MSDDIVREVRVLVDASVCLNPPIHKYSKFDRTLVIPLLEEAERLQREVEQLRYDVGIQRHLLEGEAAELRQLREMKLRVEDGRLTEAEFQAVCHNLDPADEERFKQGCLSEWRKLFGNDSLPVTAIPPPLIRGILDQVARGEMTVEAAEVRLTGRE